MFSFTGRLANALGLIANSEGNYPFTGEGVGPLHDAVCR